MGGTVRTHPHIITPTSSHTHTHTHPHILTHTHILTPSHTPSHPNTHPHPHTLTHTQRNDRGLTELNLNNHTKLDSDLIEELIVALTDNIHLERLQMANIRFSEDHAFVSLKFKLSVNPVAIVMASLFLE